MKLDRDFFADCGGGILLYSWLLLTYVIPNRILFFAPTEVPKLAADVVVSPEPFWIWIYLSCYLFVIGAWMVSADGNGRETLAKALTLSGLISGLIFIFSPTTFPRELYPFEGENLSAQTVRFFRLIDVSRNCAPSMHVATSFIAAFAYGSRGPLWAGIALIYASLIAVSTMATKQHYAWDVVTGLLLAVLCLGFARVQLDIKNDDQNS